MKTLASQHVEEYDSLFFTILAASIEQAQKDSDSELVDRLREIEEHTARLVEEQMPAEVRLVNRLMTVHGDEEVEGILRENTNSLNARFMRTVDALAANMEASGVPAMAKHLRQIKAQATKIQEESSVHKATEPNTETEDAAK